MKFIPLIWAGIQRKLSRSILILAQVIIAFTLFGVLQGLATGINQVIAAAHPDRLYVASRMRLGLPLPIAIIGHLQTVPGVVAVAYRYQFGASYQRPTQTVPVCATDAKSFFAMYPEFKVAPAAVRALGQIQNGAIVGAPHLVVISICWALGIALMGGVLPSIRAARLPVAAALRAS